MAYWRKNHTNIFSTYLKELEILGLFFATFANVIVFRSSHRRCSVRKGVLRNFAKFKGKYLCKSRFLIKLQVSACNFIKKETLAQEFSCEFYNISKNSFFTEHLWVAATFVFLETLKVH